MTTGGPGEIGTLPIPIPPEISPIPFGLGRAIVGTLQINTAPVFPKDAVRLQDLEDAIND